MSKQKATKAQDINASEIDSQLSRSVRSDAKPLANSNSEIHPIVVIDKASLIEVPLDRNSHSDAEKARKKRLKIILISVGGVLLIGLIIGLVFAFIGGDVGPEPIPYNELFYNPYKMTQDILWEKDSFVASLKGTYNPDFFRQSVQKASQDQNDPNNLYLQPRNLPQVGLNNAFIDDLLFSGRLLDSQTLQLSLTGKDRWAVPERYPSELSKKKKEWATQQTQFKYSYTLDPFTFKVTDKLDEKKIYFSIEKSSFIFMDKFIMMDLQLPTQDVYGFGERQGSFRLEQGVYTMWIQRTNEHETRLGGRQGMGVHPFILVQVTDGEYIGLYFKNSNAQSPVLRYGKDNAATLSYITTGGNIEMIMLDKGPALDVVKRYQKLIGLPYLPPFWSLGLHVETLQLDTQQHIIGIRDKYAEQNYPIESFWISQYDETNDQFSINKDHFTNFLEMTGYFHTKNQRLVISVPSGLKSKPTDMGYQKTLNSGMDIFVKSVQNADKMGGNLQYNGPNNYPTCQVDWFNPRSNNYQANTINNYFTQTRFDGVWLKDNEVTSTCAGECPITPTTLISDRESPNTQSDWYTSHQDQSHLTSYYLPFIPGTNFKENLDTSTISLNGTHSNDINGVRHSNLHNMIGHMQAETTYGVLTNPNSLFPNTVNKPFIISDSSFVGTGKYASFLVQHKPDAGDNLQTTMKFIVPSLMRMSMMGIGQVGVGTYFSTILKNDLLAERIMQLGVFLPLLVNNGNENDLYLLDKATQDNIKYYLHAKLIYSRFLYTCLYEQSRDGTPMIQPLFYTFPTDVNAKKIEDQFMIAGKLMVAPSLHQLSFQNAYFPIGYWTHLGDHQTYHTSTGSMFKVWKDSAGVHQDVKAFLRNGVIMPIQIDDQGTIMMTTTDLLTKQGISLLINDNEDYHKECVGTLLIDQGDKSLADKQFEYYSIKQVRTPILKAATSDDDKYNENEINAPDPRSQGQITFRLEDGTLNSILPDNLNQYLDSLIMPLDNTNMFDFACIIDRSYNILPMEVKYTGPMVMIPKDKVKFSQISSIQYGLKANSNACDASLSSYRIIGTLDLTKKKTSFELQSHFPRLPNILVYLSVLKDEILRVQFIRPGTSPYELPTIKQTLLQSEGTVLLSQLIDVTADPFSYRLKLVDSAYYNSAAYPFKMTETQIIQKATINLHPSQPKLFGLGQRHSNSFYLDDGTYILWNKEHHEAEAAPITKTNKETYGTHPFLVGKIAPKNYLGIFNLNSAAMEYQIKNNADVATVDVTLMSVDGNLDQLYFMSDTPEKIAKEFQTQIISPQMCPPMWMLGWQQLIYATKRQESVPAMVEAYKFGQIPVETINLAHSFAWKRLPYTIDPEEIDILKITDYLHKENRYIIHEVDTGIPMIDKEAGAMDYFPYQQGQLANCFIQDGSKTQGNLMGRSHSTNMVFYNPMASNRCGDTPCQIALLKNYDAKTKFDGLKMSIQEQHSECDGTCVDRQRAEDSKYQKLPSTPGQINLEKRAISLDAKFGDSTKEIIIHNLHGWFYMKQMSPFFSSQKQSKPILIQESTIAGQGALGFTNLGQFEHKFEHLSASLNGIMMMNMFGQNMVGTDICGDYDGVTPVNNLLCTKWVVLGSFYSLARMGYQTPFNPEIYEPTITFGSIMKQAIVDRYKFLYYYFTQLLIIQSQGGTLFKPMFFEYPEDNEALKLTDNNYMLGSAIKLSVLTTSIQAETQDFYFPEGIWCNLLKQTDKCFKGVNAYVKMSAKLYDYYLHLREGYAIPMHDNLLRWDFSTTADLKVHPVSLHINPKITKQYEWKALGNIGLETTNVGDVMCYVTSSQTTVKLITIKIECQSIKPVNLNLLRVVIYNAKAVGLDLIQYKIRIVGQDLFKGEVRYFPETDQLLAASTSALSMNAGEIQIYSD